MTARRCRIGARLTLPGTAQEFLSVLRAGFQTHILITASAPNIDGSASSTNDRGLYLQAIVTGEITLGGVVTLSGVVAITARSGRSASSTSRAPSARTSSTSAALSGSLDLGVYSKRPGGTGPAVNPGVIGRVTLALSAGGGIIPGVTLSGAFVLEVNLFAETLVNDTGVPETVVTFLTRGDKCKTDSSYCTGNQSLLAMNGSQILTGDVAIQAGLVLRLEGQMTVAGKA